MTSITFFVPGVPRGKGRARAYNVGTFIKHYTDAKTANYENLVKMLFVEAANKQGWKKIEAGIPIECQILCYFPIPKSWSNKKKEMAHWVMTKPDWDNVGKIICDALNEIAYHDDTQISRGIVEKMYGCGDVGAQVRFTVLE